MLDNKLLHCCCSVHVAKLGGWVTGKTYLDISASVLVSPLCAGGASQQAVCVRLTLVNRNYTRAFSLPS